MAPPETVGGCQERELNRLPIGVFDSGLGGLTVVRALRKHLPDESILYFGDTARVPYGPKSTETIRRFTREITRFLNLQGVKMVIVACNTCSATALDCVGMDFDGPVLGVIEPGVQAALTATRNHRIGVVGTKATINSGAYEQALLAQYPQMRVFSTTCPLFVPLAEELMGNHPATRLIAEEYLKPLMDQQIDTLILGCTHYPLLRETICQVVGPEITVVDSADCTAMAAARMLADYQLSTSPGGSTASRYFVSDDPAGLERFFRRLLPEDPLWIGTAHPDPL
jgi:glutamate racemase